MAGLEAGLPDMPAPLVVLQDTDADKVWTSWGAKWRDVVILDKSGKTTAVFSVLEHDLGDPNNRDALKKLLVEAAAH